MRRFLPSSQSVEDALRELVALLVFGLIYTALSFVFPSIDPMPLTITAYAVRVGMIARSAERKANNSMECQPL